MGTFARTSFANKVSFFSNSSEFLNLSYFGPYACECVASYNLIKFNYKSCYKKTFDKKESPQTKNCRLNGHAYFMMK